MKRSLNKIAGFGWGHVVESVLLYGIFHPVAAVFFLQNQFFGLRHVLSSEKVRGRAEKK